MFTFAIFASSLRHRQTPSLLEDSTANSQKTLNSTTGRTMEALSILLPMTLLVCFLTALLLVLRSMVSQKRVCSQLPPGPRRLPIIGHLHLLGKLPHHSLCELSKWHGPLMSLSLGSVTVIVASSPDMARQILQTHDLAFAHRQPPAAAKHILGDGQICQDIAFSQPNSHWKLMRQLCTRELFTRKALHSFQQVRREEINLLMRSVLADSGGADAAAPQMMRPKLREATNNIVTRMMLGKRLSELGKERHRKSVVELLEEILKLVGACNVGDFLPCIAWMDLQGIERRMKSVAADMRAALEGIIDARRLATRTDRGARPPTDVLLEAHSPDNPIHIMELLVDLFLGGTDTSSITVEWALAELLLNPDKLRRVQVEIDDVVGRSRLIEEEDIDHLPFLVACVKEIMRLHPVLPLLLPHQTMKACKIMDYFIPENTQAYVNVWAIGRDPKVWKNPTKFLPERFLEASNVDVQGQYFELLPFGSGRRICVGQRLGLLNVQIILAKLLQGFEWSCPPSYDLNMLETFNIISYLATPLVAYASPRLLKELY